MFNLETPGGRRITAVNVLEMAAAPPNSIVIASGSLVEGLGNRHSDVDVYVYSPELPTVQSAGKRNYLKDVGGRVRQVYDYIDDGGLGFDVEYYTFDEVKNIYKELDALYKSASSGTKILRKTLSYHDEDMIHKNYIGTMVEGNNSSIENMIKAAYSQFRFVKYRNFVGGYPEFKDIRGAYSAGDFDTAALVTREVLVEHAMALTFVAGDTNTKMKWLSRKLNRLPAELGKLGNSISHWLVAGAGDEANVEQWVRHGLELIDDIYTAIRERLDTTPGFYTVQRALELTEEEYKRETFHDPQTEEEFEFRRRQFSSMSKSPLEFLNYDVR